MTTEQLNQARATLWRQNGAPLLTADDAAAWLREAGLGLFLPRPQLATAAPTFVEAVLGAPDQTPGSAQIAPAVDLLHRLLASGDAVALNLLALPGDQPDFLATPETLPFVFALRGDKEWKRGPRGKSSPLTIEAWKLLDREGPLTAVEVKDRLGRQLTEAAALRALTELWSHLRIEPVFHPGQPTAWQLLERRHLEQMQAGSTLSQAIAISALVSLYLQSAIAASSDEVEIFLSPLASRSKIRDVLKGLTATRQLATFNLGPAELYHVEGGLPEFAEVSRPEGAVTEADRSLKGARRDDASSPAPEAPARNTLDDDGGLDDEQIGEGRRRFVARRVAAADSQGTAAAKPSRGFAKRPPETPAARSDARKQSGERRPFKPRPAGRDAGERKPYGTRGARSFNPREPWNEGAQPGKPSPDPERRPFRATDRPSGGFGGRTTPASAGKPFSPRGAAGKGKVARGSGPGAGPKPYAGRKEGEGERKPFTPRPDGRPFKPRSEPSFGARPFDARKPFGDRRPQPAPDGERKPFKPRGYRPATPPKPRGGDERRPFAPRSGDRPFKPRAEAGAGSRPFGSKGFAGKKPTGPGAAQRSNPPGASRRPFAPRETGPRKPFNAAQAGERRAPRPGGAPGGERKPFTPRPGARPFKPRPSGGPGSKGPGDRKPFSQADGGAKPKAFRPRPEARPFADRPVPSSAKPFGPRKSAGGPRTRPSSGKPPAGAAGRRTTRGPGGKPGGGFKRPGRPGKGRSK